METKQLEDVFEEEISRIAPELYDSAFETMDLNCMCIQLLSIKNNLLKTVCKFNCINSNDSNKVFRAEMVKPFFNIKNELLKCKYCSRINKQSNVTFRKISSITAFIVLTCPKIESYTEKILDKKVNSFILFLENHINNKLLNESLMIMQNQLNRIEKHIINNNMIGLPTKDGIEFFPTMYITYCKGDGNYAKVFFSNGTHLFISKPLRWIEQNLKMNDTFIKIHKSLIVNRIHISKLHRNKIIMTDNQEFEVATRRKVDFKTMLKLNNTGS